MDLLKAMHVYVAVVDSGSLVAAAQQLDTSAAAITRHLAALEAHLGARLLHRTTRRLSMSAAGQDFYARALEILAGVAEAEAVAGQQAARPSGHLRISAPLSFGISKLSKWLPAFIARYPDLRLDLDLNDRIVDLASDGVDVAVRIARQPASTNVIARRIAPIRMVICASPAYLARRGRPQSPEDLAHHDTLSYSYLAVGESWSLVGPGGREASVTINPLVFATNGDIVRDLAIADLGVIVQPAFIVDEAIASGKLAPVLEDWQMLGLSLYAVYLSRKFLSAKVRCFIDFLLESSGERAL